MDKLQFVYVSDRVDVVRCKDCKHCYSLAVAKSKSSIWPEPSRPLAGITLPLGQSYLATDPMTPYDGSGDGSFFCEAFDMEFYAPHYDAATYYCADGERREG